MTKMKPEPLKNKICYATKIVMKDTEDITYKFEGDIPFLIPKRVESAVEFLKENVWNHKSKWKIAKENIIELIDKAFEDVIK